MTNSKATKRALLSSAVSLLLCFTMLMGATFAWFTDNVSSTGNRIEAGNLKVDLVMYDGTEYTSIANGTGDIFSEAGDGLWEPGKTQVVYLGVRNKGSLALKYNVLLDIINGNPGLVGSLEYVIIPEAEKGSVTSWADAKAKGAVADVAAGQFTAAPNGVLDEVVKGVPEETDYFALAVHMKEDAGNEYQGGNITIDLKVVATQKAAEFDSFGNDYDEEATLDFFPVSNADELRKALENEEENILLTGDCYADAAYTVDYDVNIVGDGFVIGRADGYTGIIFDVVAGATLTIEDAVVDGGGAVSTYNSQSSGVVATGALVQAGANSHIVLEEGAILQNNNGANAVNLGTRIGATLTLNGGEIIHNSSSAGAVWGGGHITINSGKISHNSSTGLAGAIRMVSNCNLTMNGGEISHNTAATDGGAIWGYGASTYNFNGGEMSNNTAGGVGGAIYTGTYSTVNISGDFELHDNKAANSGAIRLTDHTSMNMTGGKVYSNSQDDGIYAFNTWNNSISITGGEFSDNLSFVGGLGLTIGAADIDGVIAYDLSTNHNTAYLTADFSTFEFTVNEGDEHFSNFNFKPADGYVYAEGDEAKLICKNEGYSTYWNAESGRFCLKAN